MGIYVNPSNESFKCAINSKIYVDKTGLIEFTNSMLNTRQKFISVARPRRFGKSMAAEMLAAYYSSGCDSRELFKGLEIEKSESFESELNKNCVIFFDVQGMRTNAKLKKYTGSYLDYLQGAIIKELHKLYPECVSLDESSLANVLSEINQQTGIKFIVIIDEWDCYFREEKNNTKLIEDYIIFLRGMFKNGESEQFIKLAYITGIFPIKKYGTQSALNNFKEFSMISPGNLARYVGFTEDEVKALCEKFDMDFDEARRWYDGYSFSNLKSVYNPNSVVDAMFRKEYQSYWSQTESFEPLRQCIGMNFEGLRDDVISMLGGRNVKVRTNTFQNDLTNIKNKNDVLTLLIHLGYLSYNAENSSVSIPNFEVHDEFTDAVAENDWGEVSKAVAESDNLLDATIEGKSDKVAEALEKIHSDCSSILAYNDENSLSCAITIAYYTARSYYTIIRELPAGKGFADLVFIPRKNSTRPALLVELKYNKDADSAIKQIKEKRYTGALNDYMGNLLLVGINYDKESKTHSCIIEKFEA